MMTLRLKGEEREAPNTLAPMEAEGTRRSYPNRDDRENEGAPEGVRDDKRDEVPPPGVERAPEGAGDERGEDQHRVAGEDVDGAVDGGGHQETRHSLSRFSRLRCRNPRQKISLPGPVTKKSSRKIQKFDEPSPIP